MASLMFEDKSGQPELLNIQTTTNSDSEDVSDSDQEGEANFVKDKGWVSNCWKGFSGVIARNKLTESKLGEVSAKKKDDEIDENDVYLDIGDLRDDINLDIRKVADLDELMKGNMIGPEFHRLHEVPTAALEAKYAKQRKLKEKAKSAGSKWFNMPAPEMTDELRREIEVIKMRSVLDPKHFYKKNTLNDEMKYFQVGRVVESSADYYHSRIPKKERKKTLVDELLANTEFKKYNRKRYKEIITGPNRAGLKALERAKRLKKKH